MKRTHAILFLLLLTGAPLWAQQTAPSGWQLHLSTGTSVTSGFGRIQSLSWVAPSLEVQASDRLTVRTGFVAAGTLLPTDFTLKGYGERSLNPLRQGTRAQLLWAQADYQVNERLRLWGTVAYMGGLYQPLWLDHSVPLQTLAFSGGFGYAVNDKSLFEMHFHFIKDNGPMGLMGPVGLMGSMGPMGLIGPMGPMDL